MNTNLPENKKLSQLAPEDQLKHIRELTKIGLALSVEKDINKLFEMIVNEARSLSNADAGTLYILEKDKKSLGFEILQNETLKDRMDGTSEKAITLPNVQLYDNNGDENHSNVSSHVTLTGETVNIPDVYQAGGYDFSGMRQYDETTGYRSKSMLVIPMKNHENKIIGVLQLLNAQNPETCEVIPFSGEYVKLIGSLASQAAVALTNAQLIEQLKNLFYAFIKSIATAIDEKSPYTGGHIKRVVDLTMMMAEKINEIDEGTFKGVYFSEDEMEELRLAAWMHDVGKITTPEYVVDKATKLETISDRIELIETRFNLIEKLLENKYLNQKIELVKNKQDIDSGFKHLDEKLSAEKKLLKQDLVFIKSCNNTGDFMSDDSMERIRKIADKTFSINNIQYPYLSNSEVMNLCIKKGTLTDKERKIIENHATMTLKITEQLPFPEKLERVPEFAGGHHEKLDGSGYPKGLSGKSLPLQSRIMAVADIFEALTAKDRPYKEPMKLSQVLKILDFMKKDNHIDPDIYDLFINKGLYRKYVKKELNPDQIDEPNVKH